MTSERILSLSAMVTIMLTLFALAVTCPARSAEPRNYTSVDPAFSHIGDKLVVKDWVCTITSQVGMKCLNTSPYCQGLYDRIKAYHERSFGCVIESNKNYPCPKTIDPKYDGAEFGLGTSDEDQHRAWQYNNSMCGPTGVGSFTIQDTDGSVR